jgi:peptidyl-prolyl cis-trans isomerase D
MLLKIREKAQGIFAWVILIAICVPFALWGIQNYVDVGQEAAVVSVGDKDFFQKDVTRAYQQFSQQLAGRGIPEEMLKEQALQKLINDEVLLQYVQDQGLAVADNTAKSYIKGLQYFQVDGKFSKQQYKALLASQNMSPEQFLQQIRNAIKMEQFQRGIMDSGFATKYDIEKFYSLQNQLRNIKYVTVGIEKSTEKLTDEIVENYYQQNQDNYKTVEQVAIEYIELSLDKLAEGVDATEEQLQAFYEEQKDIYTSKERRRISHILFSLKKDKDGDENNILEKAQKVKQRLSTEDFVELAKQVSDDTLTAKKGGDLGLFNVGTMEPAFEEAASKLKLGEVSEPVKSAFGYHLIKVTELESAKTKSFEEVKKDVTDAYKKSQAENNFYELGETLSEVSYENSGNLESAADAVGIELQKTGLFSQDQGVDLAAEQAVRNAAFSEEVLKGNNSEPVELGSDRVIVLRMIEHKPAAIRELQAVRADVEKSIQDAKAGELALTKAEKIKQDLADGGAIATIAGDNGLEVKEYPELSRKNTEVPGPVSQAAFKLAKPESAEKPSLSIVELPSGEQVVLSLFSVIAGKPEAEDKKQQQLAESSLAGVFGRTDYAATIKALEENAEIKRKEK